jgi:hypothetical protein
MMAIRELDNTFWLVLLQGLKDKHTVMDSAKNGVYELPETANIWSIPRKFYWLFVSDVWRWYWLLHGLQNKML